MLNQIRLSKRLSYYSPSCTCQWVSTKCCRLVSRLNVFCYLIINKDTSRHFTSFLQLFHEFQAGYFYTGFPLNWFNDCCSSLTERQFFKRFCVTIFTKENRLDKWLERLPVSFICGYRKSTKCLSMITP